jgi:hypothetical protein
VKSCWVNVVAERNRPYRLAVFLALQSLFALMRGKLQPAAKVLISRPQLCGKHAFFSR